MTSRFTWDRVYISKLTCVWSLTRARVNDYLVYHFLPERPLALEVRRLGIQPSRGLIALLEAANRRIEAESTSC